MRAAESERIMYWSLSKFDRELRLEPSEGEGGNLTCLVGSDRADAALTGAGEKLRAAGDQGGSSR